MKVVGLLEEDAKWQWSNEKELLETFLENDYFLIDTCPEALKGENSKVKEMKECVPSLINKIKELNPKKVIFITKTNEPICNLVAKKFQEGMIFTTTRRTLPL